VNILLYAVILLKIAQLVQRDEKTAFYQVDEVFFFGEGVEGVVTSYVGRGSVASSLMRTYLAVLKMDTKWSDISIDTWASK
jgi:hypothetical protein